MQWIAETLSSSAMETQAILEGFQVLEHVHGLRYTSFIGDGDSSVYPILIHCKFPIMVELLKNWNAFQTTPACYRSSLSNWYS